MGKYIVGISPKNPFRCTSMYIYVFNDNFSENLDSYINLLIIKNIFIALLLPIYRQISNFMVQYFPIVFFFGPGSDKTRNSSEKSHSTKSIIYGTSI